jgi:hypothetical protein
MTRRARLLAVLAVAVLATGACAGPPRATPGPVGDATAATTQQLIGALAAVGLQAADTNRPFRPPEGALLAAAPRTVLAVPLPDDPEPGWIVVYAFGSPDQAVRAAKDQAGYIASNTGRINFAKGTRFVLRVVDSTVVWFSWSPASSPDKRTATIAQALEAIGTGIDIPS